MYKYMVHNDWGVARPLANENFAFGELKCLISGPF